MQTNRTSSEPQGMTAIGIFLCFGALMAGLAGMTLTWPGSSLDRIWGLNPEAYHKLAPLGSIAGPLFLLLSAALATAAAGWLQRRLWGWWLATLIIATQVAGNLINFLMKEFLSGATGLLIAGALLFYLLRPQVKAIFKGSDAAA